MFRRRQHDAVAAPYPDRGQPRRDLVGGAVELAVAPAPRRHTRVDVDQALLGRIEGRAVRERRREIHTDPTHRTSSVTFPPVTVCV